MTATALPKDLAAAVARVDALTAAVRGHLDAEDFDAATNALTDRGTALEALREILPPDRATWPTAVRRAVDALRAGDDELMEWTKARKQDVARALGALRACSRDPYGDQSTDGPVVLDQRS